ncbi:MAG: hypothetical protein IJV04_04020, partial [Lachnospiraceae bacterium]|nr:hypothetical protein [Lachnospiraceae bacterium]
EELEQVYDRLFRSDSEGGESSDKFGLGLAITNGFVQAMGGVLHIDSIPDEGTKVTVSIPQETASEHGCLVLEDADSLAPAGFFGFLILPNPRVRDYYMRMITHLGEGWSIAFSRVTALKDLKEWLKSAPLTHLFVGTSEYLGNKDYIDRLAETVNVALIRDVVFAGEVGENITIISKPFFGIQIADFLNSSRITAKSAAEPPEEASEESEKGYDGLPTVAGLDCAQGLTYCMDDEAFYLEVLWEYANGYEEKVTDLARAFADRNWELYTIKVHAIKSTSQMIGAEELYEQARALEMAASQPDEPFLKEHHPGFLSAYEALVKDLFVALNRNETDAAVEPPAETLEFFDFFPAGGDDE